MNPLPGVDSDTPVELRRQPGTWDNRLIEKRQKVLTESGADPPAKHHSWAPSRSPSDSAANWVLTLCWASVRALSGWGLLLSNSLAMHCAHLFLIESRRVHCILCYVITSAFC